MWAGMKNCESNLPGLRVHNTHPTLNALDTGFWRHTQMTKGVHPSLNPPLEPTRIFGNFYHPVILRVINSLVAPSWLPFLARKRNGTRKQIMSPLTSDPHT